MKMITLQPVPTQSVSYMLGMVPHTATIETRLGGLYLTLWRDGEHVLHNRVLRSFAPVGFGLQMVDAEGEDDPHYEGLGTRWFLLVEDGEE